MKRHLLLWMVLLLLFPFVGARADDAFRYHRYNALKALPVNEQSIVFVGNSITNMNVWTEWFGNDPRIVNRGNSGGFTFEWRNDVEALIAGKPAAIFYAMGTNDLNMAAYCDTAVVANHLRQTIRRFEAESPNTKFIVQSVLPSNNGSRSSRIASLNEAYRNMIAVEQARGNKNVRFLEIEGMDNVAGNSGLGWSNDALHPTALGYVQWCHQITKKVGNEFGLQCVVPLFTDKNKMNQGGQGSSNGARASEFSVLPVTADDILFIGGEVVNGGEWPEFFGNHNVKNRGQAWGVGDITLAEHKTQIEQAILGNEANYPKSAPKAVILYIGQSNDAGDAFTTAYKDVINAIYTRANALTAGAKPKVYCVSLINIAGNQSGKNANIEAAVNAYVAENDKGVNADDVKYIDITSMNASMADYQYPNNSYLGGRGYGKMAELLAAAIPEVAPEAGRTPVYEAAAQANLALFTARTSLAAAIEESRDGLITATPEGIEAALATLDAMTYGSENPAQTAETAITALRSTYTSHFDPEKWYAIKMPAAARLSYVAVNNADALSGFQTPDTHSAWWKLTTRSDGTIDITDYKGRYLATGNFINYDNFNHFTVSETAPANGWTVTRIGDKYIITNGSVQLHVNKSAPKYHVMNYGSGTNTTDEGCLFTFEEIDESRNIPTLVELLATTEGVEQLTGASPAVETGWYVVRSVADGLNQIGVAAGFDIFHNRTNPISHNNQPYYLDFVQDEGLNPAMLVRFEKTGNNTFKIRHHNGGVVSEAFEMTGTEGGHSLALSNAETNAYKLGKSWPFWKTANNMTGLILGATSTATSRSQALVYKADSLAALYDVYTVATEGSVPANFSLTYNATGCLTPATVKNGGFYFFPKGTVINPESFSATADSEGRVPEITLNQETKTLTANYNNMILSPERDFENRKVTTVANMTTGWYQIKLVAGNNSIAENSRYVLNANNEQTHTNGQYALKIGSLDKAHLPSSFIHLTAGTPSATSVNVKVHGLNGHNIHSDVRSMRSESDNTQIAVVSDGFTIGSYWMVFSHSTANLNGSEMENPMVGKGSSASAYHWAIAPVTDLTPYKIYQVSIIGGIKDSNTTNLIDTRVAMPGMENKGIEKVYDGGYFFVDKDAEVTPASFVPDVIEGKTPVVTIGEADATTGIIPVTVTYTDPQYTVTWTEPAADAHYTIVVKNGDTVLPNPATVDPGTKIVGSIVPDEGYRVTAATFFGAPCGIDPATGLYGFDFDVTLDNLPTLEISATAVKLHTVTWSTPEGANYTVEVKAGETALTSPAVIDNGTELTVTVTPAEGYRVTEARIGETAMTKAEGSEAWSGTVTPAADTDLAVTATAVKLHTVTWSTPEGANYTVDVKAGETALTSPAVIAAGTELTVTVTPAEGYGLTAAAAGGTPLVKTEGSEAWSGTVTPAADTDLAVTATVETLMKDPDVTIDAPTEEGVATEPEEGKEPEDMPVFFEPATEADPETGTEATDATLTFHYTSDLKAVNFPATITEPVGKGDGEFIVSSTDETVATGELKDGRLVITHKGKLGEATVTVGWQKNIAARSADEDYSELAKVHVRVITPGNDEVTITSTLSGYETNPGRELAFADKVKVSHPGLKLIWSSTNPEVATVDEQGNVKTVGVGACEIIATVEGTDTKVSIPVKVKWPQISGIEAVNADAADGRAEIHDLTGRRISRITRAGIYIVNGEKVLVK